MTNLKQGTYGAWPHPNSCLIIKIKRTFGMHQYRQSAAEGYNIASSSCTCSCIPAEVTVQRCNSATVQKCNGETVQQ